MIRMIGYSSARLLRSGLISFRIAGRSLTSTRSAKRGTAGSVFVFFPAEQPHAATPRSPSRDKYYLPPLKV